MAKRKSNKWKKLIGLTALLLVIGLVAGAMMKKKEIPVVIQKEKVARRTLTELVVANGKIQPVVQVKISPEVSGEIIELPVKEGQHVNKGDLLVKIKPDNYFASRDSSAANYEYSLTSSNTCAANLEKARLEYNRSKELFAQKMLSESAFQEAKTAYQVATSSLAGSQQQVQMARAALKKAEDDLSKTTIYSPLSGIVTKQNSQLGERVVGTAMMAGTEIMTVSDLNEMETRVDIGEMDVVLIAVGQNARLEVDAFKNRKFKGIVTQIANSAKTALPGSSSQEATKFEVKIRFTEKDAFRPGMSVTAEIETRSRTNVLSVPIQSVTARASKKDPQTNSLALATNTPATNTNDVALKKKPGELDKQIEVVFLVKDGKAVMKPVERGISDDTHVEILEGLEEGQEVVSGGYKAISRELEDGKAVVVGSAKTAPEKK